MLCYSSRSYTIYFCTETFRFHNSGASFYTNCRLIVVRACKRNSNTSVHFGQLIVQGQIDGIIFVIGIIDQIDDSVGASDIVSVPLSFVLLGFYRFSRGNLCRSGHSKVIVSHLPLLGVLFGFGHWFRRVLSLSEQRCDTLYGVWNPHVRHGCSRVDPRHLVE
jgi:hypothetical protein